MSSCSWCYKPDLLEMADYDPHRKRNWRRNIKVLKNMQKPLTPLKQNPLQHFDLSNYLPPFPTERRLMAKDFLKFKLAKDKENISTEIMEQANQKLKSPEEKELLQGSTITLPFVVSFQSGRRRNNLPSLMDNESQVNNVGSIGENETSPSSSCTTEINAEYRHKLTNSKPKERVIESDMFGSNYILNPTISADERFDRYLKELEGNNEQREERQIKLNPIIPVLPELPTDHAIGLIKPKFSKPVPSITNHADSLKTTPGSMTLGMSKALSKSTGSLFEIYDQHVEHSKAESRDHHIHPDVLLNTNHKSKWNKHKLPKIKVNSFRIDKKCV